jgi:glycosyltransferase involved in cell wall biosynthesis
MSNRVCLAMIVKNEAKIIRRCIENAAPGIDGVVLLDTGSDDNTIEAAKEACDALDLDFHAESTTWTDFGAARTELLENVRLIPEPRRYDLVVQLDADWTLDYGGNGWNVFRDIDIDSAEAWDITVVDGTLQWPLPRITKADHPWAYAEPVHEYLHDNGAQGRVNHDLFKKSLRAVHMSDGGSRAGRHHQDVKILRGRKDTRSKFYYAQSLFAVGEYEKALDAYIERANMTDGWDEERYWAWYRAGMSAMHLGDENKAAGLCMRAWGVRWFRIEALCTAVEIWRRNELWNLARRSAQDAVDIARDGRGLSDHLFVESWRWEWGAAWELSVAKLATGAILEGSRELRTISEKHALFDGYREATEYNLTWAQGALSVHH